jgi:predicted AAA+ superfamily ATPase
VESCPTDQGYFSVFEDTLLGSWLPAYRPRAKIKEVSTPKFYWFDSGVLNIASGAFDQPMPSDWKGVLLEHWIHHELKVDDTWVLPVIPFLKRLHQGDILPR